MKLILKIVEFLLRVAWIALASVAALKVSWDLARYAEGRDDDPIVWIGTLVLLLLVERILREWRG